LKKLGWVLGVMVLLGVGAQQALALSVGTGKDAYWRYEVVDIVASMGQSENASALPATLSATVWKSKAQLVAAGNLKEVPLRRQKDGVWKGYWPIVRNPALGEYRIEISRLQADGTTLTATGAFKIKARTPYTLPKGFSVVTDEGGRKGPYATAGFTPNEPKAARNMVRWAQYMGADAFWECIGQTQVWSKLNNKDKNLPWFEGYGKLMNQVGAACHEMGLKYGAWITSFVVLGDQPKETGYTFTLGYDYKTDQLTTKKFVSLTCAKRLKDMADLMKEFEASPNIDYIGLDYMRTDWGGYEFVEEFVRDMSIKTPAEYTGWPSEQKSLWLAQMIHVARNSEVRARWEWWRSHKVSLVIRHLLDEVKPTKPVYVFSLGWMLGRQHGQDVAMMIDAGIDFNAPMFYHIEKHNFPVMVKDWDQYMERTKPSIVIGEPVDWNLLEKTTKPSGPQEHFDRQKTVIDHFLPRTHSLGLFWHDVARSQYGARGPYSTMEWVIAGAASFSELKVATGRIPYQLKLNPPREMAVGRPMDVDVEIVSAASDSISALAVELVSLPRLAVLESGSKTIRDLAPGRPRHVSLKCRTDQIFGGNGGYQMIAIRAGVPGETKDPLFAFVYLPVVSTPTPLTPTSEGAPSKEDTRPKAPEPAVPASEAHTLKGGFKQVRN